MWRVTHLPSASSSNDLALEEIKTRPQHAHGAVFVVDEQTKGRGRQGKFWHSEPGDGLYLSVCVKPLQPQQHWPLLSFVASLSMFEAMRICFGALQDKLTLKWPNDIITDKHKLAGILLEAYQDYVIIGCGVNLKNAPKIQKQGLIPGDLSMYQKDAHQAKDKLLEQFLSQLTFYLEAFENSQYSLLVDKWKGYCSMIGQHASIQSGAKPLYGRIEDIDISGSLILVDEHHFRHVITSGDVQLMGIANDPDH